MVGTIRSCFGTRRATPTALASYLTVFLYSELTELLWACATILRYILNIETMCAHILFVQACMDLYIMNYV